MSDTPTPAPTLLDKAHDAVNAAGDWLTHEKDSLVHGLVQAGLSKPVADIATVAERAFAEALPVALAAGQTAVADFLTPAHLAALAALVGEINATVVHQFLSRLPAVVSLPTPPAEEPIVPAAKPID